MSTLRDARSRAATRRHRGGPWLCACGREFRQKTMGRPRLTCGQCKPARGPIKRVAVKLGTVDRSQVAAFWALERRLALTGLA